MMRTLVVLASVLFALHGTAGAQDLEETLGEVGSDYARAYVEPLANAIGTNFNSGLVHTARWRNERFDLNVFLGVKAFATFMPSDAQTFDLRYQGSATVPVNVLGEVVDLTLPGEVTVDDAPTIFGEGDRPTATLHITKDTTVRHLGILVPVSVDTTITFETIGGLVETNIAPLLVPQAYIGTFYGTDLMIRFLPQIKVGDLGGVEVFGFGVRHSLDQYVPRLPFGLGVMVAWQGITMDDDDGDRVVDASMFAANLTATKRFGPLSLYGGFQVEESSVEVAYTYEAGVGAGDVNVGPVPIEFSVVGSNRARGLAGFALHAGPVHFSADASIGNVFIVSTGLGLGF